MNNEKNTKADKIINSLNGLKRMPAPDYFYTRLQAKMESLNDNAGKKFVTENKRYWLLRPSFAFMVLLVVLVFNVISILKQNDAEDNTTASETENIQTIATAYNLDNNLSYELNQ